MVKSSHSVEPVFKVDCEWFFNLPKSMHCVDIRISSFFSRNNTALVIFYSFSLLEIRTSLVEGGNIAVLTALTESIITLVNTEVLNIKKKQLLNVFFAFFVTVDPLM